MTKSDAITYLRKQKGFVPFEQLFDIFSYSDEIPQKLIDMAMKEDVSTKYDLGSEILINKLKDIWEWEHT